MPDQVASPHSVTSSSDRLRQAREVAARAGIDALLVSPGADLRYLTGYHAAPLERLTCLVLPSDGDPFLLVPALEEPAAQASPAAGLDLEIVSWQETEDPYVIVADRLPAHGTFGIDNRMWAEKAMAFQAALPGGRQVLAGPHLSELRMRKTPQEVEALRQAGAAIDRVHARMADWLRVGRTEREVGRDIAEAVLAEGHVTVDFVIVGSGPNSASPHHELSDRLIQAGDPVVVDIGGTTAAGYCSDSTRCYVLGEPPAEYLRMYEVLLRAQRAQTAAVRPGLTAEQLDAVGRDIITDAGYGPNFVHRTGHGIGLETHEEPYIVAGSARALEPGMAFSVEPGSYLPGRFGARIEDIVVCTSNGGERLNLTSRELTVLAAH